LKVSANTERDYSELVAQGKLPHYFLPAYRLLNPRDKIVYFTSEADAVYCAARVYRVKFLRCLQFLFPPVSLSGPLDAQQEAEFMNSVVELIAAENIAHRIVQPLNSCIFKAVPRGSVHCPFGSYRLQLSGRSEEMLFSEMHTKHRNSVRSAGKQGAEVRFGHHLLAEFYSIYAGTMSRNGLFVQDLEYFRTLLSHLKNNALCAVVYYEGQPVGGALVTYGQYSAFYEFGGSTENAGVSGALNLLQWRIIQFLRSMNIQTYDFVGARIVEPLDPRHEGIQRFKQRFGATLYSGFLWKMDMSAFRCRVFDTLIGLKHRATGRKKPVDIIQQERAKSGYAGN
jgi:hypothetical protein